MFFCLYYKSNSYISPYTWYTNHFSRYVVGMKKNYSIISRRYICHKCKEDHDSMKMNIQNSIYNSSFNIAITDIEEKSPSYTFIE